MEILPDWLPNIHPLLIHFPIVLLLGGIVFEVLFLIFKNKNWIRLTTIILYSIGYLFLIVTYLSGKQAVDSIEIPVQAYLSVSNHADMADFTLMFFSLFLIVRLVSAWKNWDKKLIFKIVFSILAFEGGYLLLDTAEDGGKLVFLHGLGVSNSVDYSEKVLDKSKGFSVFEDGSWTWAPEYSHVMSFYSTFNLLEGSLDQLILNQKDSLLEISIQSDHSFLFVTNHSMENIISEAEINLDGFDGEFAIVHHVKDAKKYDFFSVNAKKGKLGRTEGESINTYFENSYNATGWLTIKAVGSKGHFRGYIGEKLVAHGHAQDLMSGKTGFRISGKGILIIKSIKVYALR